MPNMWLTLAEECTSNRNNTVQKKHSKLSAMSAKCPNLLKLCAVEKNFRQVTFNFQSHQLFSGQKSIKTEETK